MKNHRAHVLRSIRNQHFYGKRIGELSPGAIGILFKQWVPLIRAQWAGASVGQRTDCLALESAFKAELGAPWEQ